MDVASSFASASGCTCWRFSPRSVLWFQTFSAGLHILALCTHSKAREGPPQLPHRRPRCRRHRQPLKALTHLWVSVIRLLSDDPLVREDGDRKELAQQGRQRRRGNWICFAFLRHLPFNISNPTSSFCSPRVLFTPAIPRRRSPGEPLIPTSPLNSPRCCPGTPRAPPRYVLRYLYLSPCLAAARSPIVQKPIPARRRWLASEPEDRPANLPSTSACSGPLPSPSSASTSLAVSPASATPPRPSSPTSSSPPSTVASTPSPSSPVTALAPRLPRT